MWDLWIAATRNWAQVPIELHFGATECQGGGAKREIRSKWHIHCRRLVTAQGEAQREMGAGVDGGDDGWEAVTLRTCHEPHQLLAVQNRLPGKGNNMVWWVVVWQALSPILTHLIFKKELDSIQRAVVSKNPTHWSLIPEKKKDKKKGKEHKISQKAFLWKW